MALSVIAGPIMERPFAAGDDEATTNSEPPAATSVPHLRSALRPLLTLSRLVGLAPYKLNTSNQISYSLPTTAYSTLLLVAYAALVCGYVAVISQMRYSRELPVMQLIFFTRMFLEVGVGLVALASTVTSSGFNRMRELLEKAENAATLLSYKPQHAYRLLFAQAFLVVALLPPYLYLAEEEYMGLLPTRSRPLFELTTLQSVVVYSCRACTFVLNAISAMQFYALAQLTAQLWQRFLGELEKRAGTPLAPSDAQSLQRIHVALTDLVDQVNSAFGHQTMLQVYNVLAAMALNGFFLGFRFLITEASLPDVFFWVQTPQISLCAMSFAQLLSMSLPCASIETSAAQCVGLLRTLIDEVRAGSTAHETRWTLSEMAAHKVRLETAYGASLGSSLCRDTIALALAYILLIAQFNCYLMTCKWKPFPVNKKN